MDIKRILAELKTERAKLEAAISAIEGTDSRSTRRGTLSRRLSAAARKRISDAQKARWAKNRKASKA